MFQELMSTIRGLSRHARFLALASLTLGAGVGAATVLFSVVDGVLLQPLPYRDPARIGILWHEFGHGAQNLPAVHPLDAMDYQARAQTLSDMTLATGGEEILGGRSDAELVQVGRVAANFFTFFGVSPASGRPFRTEEDVAGGPTVALLSHRLWERRFGSDPAVVGRTIDLSGISYEIVGILPPTFRLELPAEAFRLRDADIWRLAQIDQSRQPPRNFTGFTAFVRLAPTATFAQAQDELNTLAAGLRAEHREHEASSLRVRLEPLGDDVVKGAKPALTLLMLAVGLLLVMTCANVALLMLAQAQRREREMLIRIAIGAGRERVARLVVVESFLVAAGGAALGVAIALGGVALVRRLAGSIVPRLHTVDVDLRVLSFALVVACASALVCGVIPVLRTWRLNAADTLRETAVGTRGRRARLIREGLVLAQVVLSVVLVAGAGLVGRSFSALGDTHPGFDANDVVTFRVSLPPTITREAQGASHRALQSRLAALPGVTSVSLVSHLPLSGRGPLQPFAYDTRTAQQWESESADEINVSPGFFSTLGADFVNGRDFEESDAAEGRRVIVIDDVLARRAFGSETAAVGRRLQLEPEGTPESFSEVVGVVRHLRYHDLRREVLPQIFRPGLFARFNVAVRANGGAVSSDRVRAAVADVVPGAVVDTERQLSTLVDNALGPTRFAAAVMVGFGLMALLLAAVGVYGACAYAVGERRRELAVRLALGASPRGVRALVLARALRYVVPGLLVGTAMALAVGRLSASVLYGVSAFDWRSHVAALAALGLTSLAASWVPAWRAGQVDPLATLRQP